MTRERQLLVIALPVLVLAVFLLRNEYAHYYATRPAAQLPDGSRAAMSVAAPSTPLDMGKGVAPEEVPKNRTAEEDTIIAHAKDAPVSMLDSSLPHQSAGYWISRTAGMSARVRWEVNNCPGAGKESDSTAICAQANVEFSNGTLFQALILLGEKSQESGPVKYAQPSLLWAAYQKTGGALTPASLNLLQRIAREAS